MSQYTSTHSGAQIDEGVTRALRLPESLAETSTATATTTALGPTTTKHLLTGTTTITGFSGTAGVTYHCRAEGSFTLTHHATNLIITQGAANITTAAGDTFDVQMITGTTCRIVNYQWAGSNTKLISFTRSMSAASGNVSYSAVGFKPSVLLFMASIIDGTSFASWGMGLPGTDFSVSTRPTGYAPSSPWSIMLYEDTSLWQGAKVESLDDDGFTLAWTKTGAPDYRLATIYCLAIR